jgi:membrane-bound lytic murein transglycosylase D
MEEPISMNQPSFANTSGLIRLRRHVVLLSGAIGVALSSTGWAQENSPEPPRAAATAPAVPRPVAAAPVPLATPASPAAPVATTNAAKDDLPVAEAPMDPLNPDAKVNFDDEVAHQDLWQRIRDGYRMPDLNDEYVTKWEQHYGSKSDYMQRMMDRGGRYLFHIVEEVQRRGLPGELALLPFVESAFVVTAVSSARAAGMWQFMPGTGRDFRLRQNMFRDDRRDVMASTRAALDYLTRLHRQFGDWHLALAAYNWGEGSVARAIKKNQAEGLPTDYASLRMPAETRNYVPKLQAIKNIVGDPARFALTLPKLENHPYFLAVPIKRDIDVVLAAKLADISLAEFRMLNPQMNKPVILAAGTPQVLLPYDNAGIFMKSVMRHRGAMASLTAWVAPRTMKTAEAARQVGMSDDELRALNNIPPRMLVKAGSTLLVDRSEHRQNDVSESIADNASLSLAPDIPPLKRVAFRAGKRGTTVADVAKRYRVSPAQVAQWNKVTATGKFAGGSTVVVWVPNKPAAAATRVAAGSAKPGKAVVAVAKPSAKATKTAKATPSKASTKAPNKATSKTATKTAKTAPSKALGGKSVKVADARAQRNKVR